MSTRTLGVRLSVTDKILVTVVIILFGIHMTASKTAFLLLTCSNIDASIPATVIAAAPSEAAGTVSAAMLDRLPAGCTAEQSGRRLLMDLEVCCHNPDALAIMYGLGIPGVVLYAIGIPVVAGTVLYRSRDAMHDPRKRATLGFLTAGLKQEHQYWESVIMLRKVGIAAVAVLLAPQGAAIQTYAALLLVFVLTVVHTAVKPFAKPVLNRLELAALVTAFVTFECGLFITSTSVDELGKQLATAAIFIANVAFLLGAMGMVGAAWCRQSGGRPKVQS